MELDAYEHKKAAFLQHGMIDEKLALGRKKDDDILTGSEVLQIVMTLTLELEYER